jgi:hypothetical protein
MAYRREAPEYRQRVAPEVPQRNARQCDAMSSRTVVRATIH